MYSKYWNHIHKISSILHIYRKKWLYKDMLQKGKNVIRIKVFDYDFAWYFHKLYKNNGRLVIKNGLRVAKISILPVG